jgi:hypothetical protein
MNTAETKIKIDAGFFDKLDGISYFVNYFPHFSVRNINILLLQIFIILLPMLDYQFFELILNEHGFSFTVVLYEGVFKSFRTESVTKYTPTFGISR